MVINNVDSSTASKLCFENLLFQKQKLACCWTQKKQGEKPF